MEDSEEHMQSQREGDTCTLFCARISNSFLLEYKSLPIKMYCQDVHCFRFDLVIFHDFEIYLKERWYLIF